MASLLLPLLLLVASVLSATSAEPATIYSMTKIPDWQQTSIMGLQITAPDGDAVPITYNVFPLTASLGLNETNNRRAVWIRGNMVAADQSNYVNLTSSDTIAYLCCDNMNSSYITPNMMVNGLMANKPKAILLYSINGNCCGLGGSNLPYQSVFTMSDSAEAAETLNLTNSADGIVQATISANVSTAAQDDQDNQNGSSSAVAMSILYSITGLITLLFLIIIATGAIRAHRYPERYGPRSGYGGRPRQSRAKGLARAVLETIPIVKFGDPATGKPDPALELEHQPSRSSHDPATGTRLSAIPEEPQPQQQRQSGTVSAREAPGAVSAASLGADVNRNIGSGTDVVGSGANGNGNGPEEEHLGCSICTEDFTVGEDVRVLPCDHKFHPPCIDPWLISVSGTCPLCRLDLSKPQGDKQDGVNADGAEQLPPPLTGEWNEHDEVGGSSHQRRRSSRLLDLHRLRQAASPEERIEILRRHRSQQQRSPDAQQAEGGESEEQRGRRARLADRLREKFRIRTKTQAPGQSPPRQSDSGEGPSS
ncbi:hypothetical protein QBC46DRAFT_1483 [Diplogelasinospora grovesii]|uniref:RING-type domain-containing protein n=1 Tax=Diplogelasinospora grovesii TaxID=303347 RepID=A0AAN6NM37_9PEZI|nr:hypothetical protein QBC46DRAFT_1483 [Diplogelasinospora grovesii]